MPDLKICPERDFWAEFCDFQTSPVFEHALEKEIARTGGGRVGHWDSKNLSEPPGTKSLLRLRGVIDPDTVVIPDGWGIIIFWKFLNVVASRGCWLTLFSQVKPGVHGAVSRGVVIKACSRFTQFLELL